MGEPAAPAALVIDGSDLASSGPGKPSLARLESGIAALRGAIPATSVVVIVDADLALQVGEPEATRLVALVESGVIDQVPPDSRATRGAAILTAAEARQAVVVSNESFYQERDHFPWLTDPERLIGHSYGGDGWWVFMSRSPGARTSWSAHDGAAPVEILSEPSPAPGQAAAPQEPQTYEELIRMAPPSVAIVPLPIVEGVAALVFAQERVRPRDELVAEIVTRDLGLSMYGATALVYRFEGAEALREVEPGVLERAAELTEAAATDQVAEAILRELLSLGDSALGERDEAAARLALGMSARPPEPTPAVSKQAASRAAKKASAAKPSKKAPVKKAAVKKAGVKKAAATRAASKNATARKAPAKKASAVKATANKAPAKPAPADRPRLRTGPSGPEWVVRCRSCGVELAAPDRAGATAALAAHECDG